MRLGEGPERLPSRPQYRAETEEPVATEGGFQEPSKTIFQKENVTFLDEKQTHSVKRSRTESGR